MHVVYLRRKFLGEVCERIIVKVYLFFRLNNQTVMELCSSRNTWAKAFVYSVLVCHLKISFMKLNFELV